MKNKLLQFWGELKPREIQSTIMIAFSFISIFLMLIMGLVMYNRFVNASREENVQNTQKLIEQTGKSLEDYLVSMRQISDAAYYNTIKESDFSKDGRDIQEKMNLLYEANKDKLRSIALYNNYGNLLMAEPVANEKTNVDVTKQEWFTHAMNQTENMHFSTPHIQNLFDDGTRNYYWVISLSRAVELTSQGNVQTGVLLVDMDFSGISWMMKQINTSPNGQYYYLCDSSGKIIYHPRQIQITEGIYKENTIVNGRYRTGVYDEVFEGSRRKVVVDTISYTGWKLVGVIPYSAFTHGMLNIRYFVVLLTLLTIMMLVVVNRIVSARISSPIMKLNDSVKKYEAGEKPEIYIGGSLEIRHLGYSIQKSYERIDTLMKEIVVEQNERRKSELDALQSQINPHFLYNALDSIIWMIEGERNDEASYMISQLAKLFRISLSKGRTVIPVRDELQHARSYMNIQKIRYKNTFSVEYDIDPSIEDCCTVKLILQPILENAINYGVNGMEDCGEITVTGRKEDGCVVLTVEDNGLGMSREEAALLLTDSNRVHKKGSGVGLVNVDNRIKILFGREYGLHVDSEPDEGTRVSIRIPAIPYSEENRKIVEQGHIPGNEEKKTMELTVPEEAERKDAKNGQTEKKNGEDRHEKR